VLLLTGRVLVQVEQDPVARRERERGLERLQVVRDHDVPPALAEKSRGGSVPCVGQTHRAVPAQEKQPGREQLAECPPALLPARGELDMRHVGEPLLRTEPGGGHVVRAPQELDLLERPGFLRKGGEGQHEDPRPGTAHAEIPSRVASRPTIPQKAPEFG
jgi:hypothetical protein